MGDSLGEGTSLGGEQDDGLFCRVAGVLRRDAEGLEAVVDRPGFEHHAFAAAKGAVVDSAVPVVGEGAEVVGADIDEIGGDGALENAVIERAGKKTRERL